jgi:lysophospholipase L1-like esterase
MKIMPLGDSITAGSYGDGLDGIGGYRGPLWKKCKQAGWDIDFVGSQKDPEPADFDNDHEGNRGARIEALSDGVIEYLNNSKPDIILLQAGINNTLFGVGPEKAAENAVLLDTLVGRIVHTRPEATLFVASIMGVRTPNDYDVNPKTVREYNNLIPGIVDKYAAKNCKIQFVDINNLAAFETDDFHADGLHPSDRGYEKIARAWFETLRPGQ